ncbi:cytochrome P450 [Halarchaeum nitratireducens]|uniref:Cytochrome P450 n=1 Tax=Halarchaeum nitratireducens TaxID=489913 RepID=A0A830GDJ2_9EURY|nr:MULTISPECIES: cytochrome P450 [Halarchaeum]MBP2252282.1 cytochrome P450 [Halarchaeum solikamskense]GGN17634.1 cytochrome P450 [Halarchaeum nitratireducens]
MDGSSPYGSDGGTPAGLREAGAAHDPFGWYDERRRTGAVHYDPEREVYDVFTHEHVKAALQDDDALVRKPLSREEGAHTPFAYLDEAMVWSDGPEHTASKHQFFEFFRPDRLRALRGSIREIADDQFEVARRDGPEFDFVAAFARPVPLRVVMDLVGVPRDDQGRVLTWLETFREVMNSEHSAAESGEGERMAEAVDYLADLVARRRADPADDLVSRLVEETTLDDATIGANCFDFLLAGQGTMTEHLSNALYLLDDHDLFADFDEYDLDVVLEEVLRYRAPLQARARETTRPVTIAGTTIPAGETVVLWIGAANRDPARYDAPEEFRPTRDPDHLAFGTGPHTCIGAPLARLEAPIVLRAFAERVDELGVDLDAAVPKAKASKTGFERLPVSIR